MNVPSIEIGVNNHPDAHLPEGQLGEAVKLLSGFKFEACSYDLAVQLLKDNYGRESRISYALVTELDMSKPHHNTSSLSQFMAKYDGLYKPLVAQDIGRG